VSAIRASRLTERQGVLASEKAEVESYGGHEGWLRAKAKALLPLFPSGVPKAVFESDTLALWLDGAARAEQCARCPPYGGACWESHLSFPDGQTVHADPEKGLRSDFCSHQRVPAQPVASASSSASAIAFG
jgi:hypothetical protein